jgi:hypothetical protein
MKVVFHVLVKKDLKTSLAYYDSEGGRKLGDRFFDEVEATIAGVLEYPKRHHFVDEGLRRAPLPSFPFHFL